MGCFATSMAKPCGHSFEGSPLMLFRPWSFSAWFRLGYRCLLNWWRWCKYYPHYGIYVAVNRFSAGVTWFSGAMNLIWLRTVFHIYYPYPLSWQISLNLLPREVQLIVLLVWCPVIAGGNALFVRPYFLLARGWKSMFTILIPYWSPVFNGEKCLIFACALIAKIKTEVSVVPEDLPHLMLTISLYIILRCFGFQFGAIPA